MGYKERKARRELEEGAESEEGRQTAKWFIQQFAEKPARIVRTEAVVARLLARRATEGDASLAVEYADGVATTFYFDRSAELFNGAMISPPCDHADFFADLFAILSGGEYILFAPDGQFPICAAFREGDDLNRDLLEAMGAPRVAKDPAEFRALVRAMQE